MATKARVGAILLDFDGTVVNSGQLGMNRAIQLVLEAGHFLPENIVDRLIDEHHWSKPGVDAFRDGFHLSQEEAERLYHQLEAIDKVSPAPLLPHAREKISWLRRVVRVGLVTSRKRENLQRVLDHHCLEGLFDHITALDDSQYGKPDCRTLDRVMDYLVEHGIREEQCLIVGDSPQDALCGINRGIPAVGVLTGVYKRQHLISVGLPNDNIIGSVANLYDWLEERDFYAS